MKNPAKSYAEKLKDPRWQRKRLEALQSADFKCQRCLDSESTLHVHHAFYVKGREPWEYENNELLALCDTCHSTFHEEDELVVYYFNILKADIEKRSFGIGQIAGYIAACGNRSLSPIHVPDYSFAAGFGDCLNVSAENVLSLCVNDELSIDALKELSSCHSARKVGEYGQG